MSCRIIASSGIRRHGVSGSVLRCAEYQAVSWYACGVNLRRAERGLCCYVVCHVNMRSAFTVNICQPPNHRSLGRSKMRARIFHGLLWAGVRAVAKTAPLMPRSSAKATSKETVRSVWAMRFKQFYKNHSCCKSMSVFSPCSSALCKHARLL